MSLLKSGKDCCKGRLKAATTSKSWIHLISENTFLSREIQGKARECR